MPKTEHLPFDLGAYLLQMGEGEWYPFFFSLDLLKQMENKPSPKMRISSKQHEDGSWTLMIHRNVNDE